MYRDANEMFAWFVWMTGFVLILEEKNERKVLWNGEWGCGMWDGVVGWERGGRGGGREEREREEWERGVVGYVAWGVWFLG
jgi:hypothetical protein